MNKLKNIALLWYPSMSKKPLQFATIIMGFMSIVIPLITYCGLASLPMPKNPNWTPVYVWFIGFFFISGFFGWSETETNKENEHRWSWGDIVDAMTDEEIVEAYNKLQRSKMFALRYTLRKITSEDYSEFKKEKNG
jgi:hypothetical protein